MAQIELNDGLAQHMIKAGDPGRNPTGKQGTPSVRRRACEIRAALYAEAIKPCEEPGFEHMTNFELGIRNVFAKFKEGDRWAVKFVCDRLFGRVPLTVDVTVEAQPFTDLTDVELADRAEALARRVRADAARLNATDAVVLEDTEAHLD